MFVPLIRDWKGGWCQYHEHPTFQEIVDMAEKTDAKAINNSLSAAFFGVTDEDFFNEWLFQNTQGQRG